MAEYIKRKDAEEYIKNFGKGAISDGLKTLDPVDDIVSLARGLDMIPAADVVEVVRCKDCEHKVVINSGRVMCNRNAVKARFYDNWYGLTATDDNHFCSYGKKKEGAEV